MGEDYSILTSATKQQTSLITAKNTVVNGLFSTSLLGKLKPLPAITAN